MKATTLTPVPGITAALSEITRIFAKAAPQLPPSAKPKFPWPSEPVDYRDPWKHFDKLETVGLYVVRDVKGVPTDVEIVVEIESYRFPDKSDPDDTGDVILGHAFRVNDASQDWLSLEEEDEAREAFKRNYGRD